MQASADIGLIGLAVMGQNLVLNMNDHGFTVAVHNRTVSRVDEFVAGEARGTRVIGAWSIPELVSALKRPRRVMLLVKAGPPVDALIAQVAPHLEPGDVVIDGGNSNYLDSIRRAATLEAKGLLFVGTGVSGGEEGARHGPSLMPGGSPAAWPHIRPIFQARPRDTTWADANFPSPKAVRRSRFSCQRPVKVELSSLSLAMARCAKPGSSRFSVSVRPSNVTS